MLRFSAIWVVLFCCLSSQAQRTCLTAEYAAKMPASTGAHRPYAGRIARDTVKDELIIIPVVIHVLYNTGSQNISNAQILSQLESLNKDFSHLNADTSNTPAAFKAKAADCRIRFCLAKVDPQGRLTGGIIRKHTNLEYFLGDDGMKFSASGGDDAWDSRRYLNIWVCNMFGRSLGYATPPGGPEATDGVVINFDVFGTTGFLRAPFNKGRTTTHEVGHWLGLKHIWGDALCGSDEVDDTPPQKSYNYGCPSFPKTSTCSADSKGDMFMNFMDFSDDACMNMFTAGQKNKMRSCFSLNAHRNGFLDSDACDSSNATSGAPAPNPEPGPVAVPVVTYMTVHPSPAQSFIEVKGMGGLDISGKTFDVVNMVGERVLRISCDANNVTVNISHLAAGIYYIRDSKGSNGKVIRFIKL